MSTVTLDESKFAVAKIKLEEAHVAKIPTGVSVVGQIEANSEREVEIRPRAGHGRQGPAGWASTSLAAKPS